MAKRKGFTLIELIVVLIIVGIFAAIAIPNYIAFQEQTNAQVAQNNLLAISSAQQRYFEDNTGAAAAIAYCTNFTALGATLTCGTTTATLLTGLRLSTSANDPFNYSCTTDVAPVAPYQCTATDGTDTLTLTVTALTASVNCTGPTGYCPQNIS